MAPTRYNGAMPSTIIAQDNDHLKELVAQAIATYGPLCDLNYIDVSVVTEFTDIFRGSRFNGEISKWDTSRAIGTNHMFEDSKFAGDLSEWRLPKCVCVTSMFESSAFNGDVSKWDVGNIRDFRNMFDNSAFAGDLSSWQFRENCMFGSMLSPSFTGSLPFVKEFPENECRTGEYEQMFGGGDKLHIYLARRPFDHSHAAYVMDIPARPLWLEREDFVWLRSFVRTGRQLGLDTNELIHATVSEYRQYKLDHEPVSLVEMDLT